MPKLSKRDEIRNRTLSAGALTGSSKESRLEAEVARRGQPVVRAWEFDGSAWRGDYRPERKDWDERISRARLYVFLRALLAADAGRPLVGLWNQARPAVRPSPVDGSR